MTDLDNKNDLIDLSKYKILEEKIVYNEKLGMNDRIIIVKEVKPTSKNVLNYIHSYIEQNKDTVYKKNNERNKERYKNDPEYREKKIKQYTEYRRKKKEDKELNKNNDS